MRKFRYLFNFVVITVVVISCNTYDLPAGTPDCISDAIKDFQTNHICDTIRVEQYSYKGNRYYCFAENCCCDVGSNWYDEECNLVCISGTIAGTINCTIPLDSLKFDGVIWQE